MWMTVHERGQTGVPRHALHIRARCGSNGSGRPEELIEELGVPTVHAVSRGHG